jgi:hypothetical protein
MTLLIDLVPRAPGGHITPATLESLGFSNFLPSCLDFFSVAQHYAIQIHPVIGDI